MWENNSPWMIKLEGADFQWAKETIAMMFQIADEEANKKGQTVVYKNDYLDALRPFMENPCLQTAVAIFDTNPSLWSVLGNVFEKSKNSLTLSSMPPTEPTDEEIENAKIMPLIENGISSIKLGVFTKLSKKFHAAYEPQYAVLLSFCVTKNIFCEPIVQPTFQSFAENNLHQINQEIYNTFTDKELSELILLAYAARMIALGWETRNPFNDTANKLTDIATTHDMEIPNIVRMWGSKAIIKFFNHAQEFMLRTINV